VLKGALLYAAGLVQHALSSRLTREVRREMTAALASSDYMYVVAQSSGRVTSEVTRATSAFLSFSRLIPSITNAGLFFAILLWFDWQLTAAVTVVGGG